MWYFTVKPLLLQNVYLLFCCCFVSHTHQCSELTLCSVLKNQSWKVSGYEVLEDIISGGFQNTLFYFSGPLTTLLKHNLYIKFIYLSVKSNSFIIGKELLNYCDNKVLELIFIL